MGCPVAERRCTPTGVAGLQDGQLDLDFLVDYPDAPQSWPANLRVIPWAINHLNLAAPADHFNITDDTGLAG